jgi:hypothetical protein
MAGVPYPTKDALAFLGSCECNDTVPRGIFKERERHL